MTISPGEVEARLLYSIIVAGKSAKFTEGVMNRLFPGAASPFDRLRELRKAGGIEKALREARSGNYGKIARAFEEILDAKLNLLTVTPEELEKIHGIGPKTSRFFIIWTRPQERYAALDVHVLRWLRKQGYKAPNATPTGRKYRELELAFLAEADKRSMTPRELDAQIWEEGSGWKDQTAYTTS